MKIGFVGNLPPPVGGAEVFLGQFLSRFLRKGRRCATLIRWRKQRFNYFPEQVTRIYAPRGTVRRSEGLTTHYLFEALDRRRGERDRFYQDRLMAHYAQHGRETARIFGQARVELIHAHMLFPNLPLAAMAAEALSIPLVLTIHGMLEFRILEFMRVRYPDLAGWVEASIPKTKALVAVSDEIAKASRKAGARRIEKLPCGVDTAFFRPPVPNGNSAEDLLFIGTVRQEKGAPLLIQAFERIRDSVKGNLVFAGKRLIQGPTFERARRNHRIRFLGEQPPSKVRQLLQRARLVVLPSASEGLPLSILEAMAFQKPVLVSRTGELNRLIRDGENGFLIEKRNPSALADQIQSILSRPDLAAVGARARRTAMNFDIGTTVKRHESLYRKLLS